MSFSSVIRRFSKRTNRDIDKVFRGTALGLFSAIITRTPVDSGRLRANWIASSGKPIYKRFKRTDKSGAVAISSAAAIVMRTGADSSLYLANSLPYASEIENGSSKQAPAGMVKVTVAEFQREVKKQVRKL